MKAILVVVLSLFAIAVIAAQPQANHVNVYLNKEVKSQWTVTFSAKEPMQRLVFHKSPNFSRPARWKPEYANFTIENDGSSEFVVRKDESKFSSVKFILSTSYTHLPKEYAPFSPFSDGGMLIHTRRFFACAEYCPQDLDYWQFNVSAPKTDAIIVSGETHMQNVSWVESGWGSKLYVGSTLPFEDENFIFVIDQKLPAGFKQKLDESLPKLTQRLSELMARPQLKPMFFASYSEPQGRSGRQGGTLPEQIFVQWFGKDTATKINPKNELWFITHEMAHFYQKDVFTSESPEAQWVHEGHTEIMAGLTG